MTVIDGVRARLLAQSGVTALVASRIYAQTLPQSPTLPAVRLQVISEDEALHLRGTNGLLRTRVQVDSIAEVTSGSDVRADATAVDAAVHGDGANSGLCAYTGVSGGIHIESVLPADRREGYDAEELRQYVVSRDYYVTFRAA